MDTSARNIYRILAIIASFVLLLAIAVAVKRQLIWIGTAAFLAIALNPAVEWFSKNVTKRHRGPAIALTFVGLLLILVVLVASLVPPVVRQSRNLVDNLPQYTNTLTNSHNIVGETIRKYDLVKRVKSDQVQLVRQGSQFSGSFFTVVRNIFSSLAATVVVLGLTFFMLLEGPRWINTFWYHYGTRERKRLQNLVHQMYRAVTGYVNGNVLTSIIAGIVTAIMLIILGVPYVAPLSLFVAVMDLVPLVGATFGATAVILVSLFHSALAGAIMLVFYIIFQQVENHVTIPIVYGKTVRISPLLVLVAVLIGAGLGKLLGALVAIPAAASLQILVKDYLHSHNVRQTTPKEI